MSRLREMIARLCPNGVEYRKLGEIAHYSTSRIDAKSLTPRNYIGVENLLPEKGGKIDSVSVPKVGRMIEFRESDVLIGNIRPYLKKIWLADCNGGTNGDVLVLQIEDRDFLLPEFLYHALASDSFFQFDMQFAKGAKMPRGDKGAVLNYPIPLPPLEIQREVVEILDNFAQLTAELTANLTAELAKRKKQYEHYRDMLLNFEGEVKEVSIGKLFPFIRNGFVGTVTPYYTDKDHGVRYLEGTNVHDGLISDNEFVYVTKSFHNEHLRSELKADDIVMVQSGHVGECAVVGERYAGSNCHALIIMTNGGMCDSKFVVYYLHSAEGKRKLERITTGGTIKHILASTIQRVTIPLPPLAEQKRIVAILDRFDSLCNSLTEGLPAEIALRKKQYEYYRDKLLSFKEAG